jgi:hypothetical protein
MSDKPGSCVGQAARKRLPLTKRHLLYRWFGPNGGEQAAPENNVGCRFLLISRTETPVEKFVLSNSREPPALTFPGRTRGREECRW